MSHGRVLTLSTGDRLHDDVGDAVKGGEVRIDEVVLIFSLWRRGDPLNLALLHVKRGVDPHAEDGNPLSPGGLSLRDRQVLLLVGKPVRDDDPDVHHVLAIPLVLDKDPVTHHTDAVRDVGTAILNKNNKYKLPRRH